MKRPRIDLWYRIARFLTKVFLPTFGRVEVVGRENIPKDGPIIIAPNHQSDADPPVLVYAINRPIWFMAKRGLFKGPVVSYLLKSLHVYPVDRDGRDTDAVVWSQQMLTAGRALVIFPEGTRTHGGLGPGMNGLSYIAARAGVPVLPVAITGTEKIHNMLRIPVHFQHIRIVIGKPLPTQAVSGRLDRSLLAETTQRIMLSIAGLLPPSYRGTYAEMLAAEEQASSS